MPGDFCFKGEANLNQVQKLQLALEVRRKELAQLLDNEERAEDFQDKLGTAKKLISDAQAEVAAAALAEPVPEVKEEARVSTPEGAEVAELRQRAQFGQYVLASGARRGVMGAEAELNAALGIGELDFPMDMLAPAEVRAAIDGDGEANQGSWLDMLFAEASATKLGVSMRSVGSGIAAYPITTSGPIGVQRQRAEAVGAVSLGLTVHEMKPTRMATHLIYSVEDVARLPGLADAIRREMSDALVDSLDKAIFLGATTAGTEADVHGFQTASGIGEPTLTQSNKVKGPNTLEAFTNQVDGKYASGPADIRVVSSQGAYKLWSTTIVAAAVSNQTIAGIPSGKNGISWSVRGDIESNSANGDFGAFMGLARGIEGAAVLAVWEQGNLVTDPYSGADKGEIALTMNTLWNFAIVRTANFKRLKFVS